MNILGYGCSTSAGKGVSRLWQGLQYGIDHSAPIRFDKTSITACTFKRDNFESYCQFMSSKLVEAYKESIPNLEPSLENVGVIFASTKGCIDDFVWSGDKVTQDPLVPVLREFLKATNLENCYYTGVSNACASSLSALYLAQQWLKQKRFKYVLVLAADMIGPFVAQGFQTLRILSPEKCRPFDKNRQGTQLGDAACSLLLSSEPSQFEISDVKIHTEGFAVTRPSGSGESLKRVCAGRNPDLIIAHGTATQANDEVEDKVFYELFGNSVPITATKWSVGHTLGASGAVDVITACEVLKHQKTFPIANTKHVDLKCRYLTGSDSTSEIKNILVTSLGFGGVHGAATVRLHD